MNIDGLVMRGFLMDGLLSHVGVVGGLLFSKVWWSCETLGLGGVLNEMFFLFCFE